MIGINLEMINEILENIVKKKIELNHHKVKNINNKFTGLNKIDINKSFNKRDTLSTVQVLK